MKNWKNYIIKKLVDLKEFITDNPVESIMVICFAVGFILGAIIF